MATGSLKPGHSQSLERGLAILSAFRPGQSLLGISDLVRLLGLTGPTAHRYVATLAGLGYLQQDVVTRKYRLGPRALDFGLAALESVELREIATPLLRTLSDRSGHTVNMAVLTGLEIVYVERIRSLSKEHLAIDLDIRVGSRQPAYCTAMGKTLLAFLPGDRLSAVIEQMEFVKFAPNTIATRPRLIGELDRIRAAGIGTCDEEFAVGIRSVAAPVHVHTGEVTAAISVHVHTSTLTLKQLIGKLGPGLRHTADEISLQAGYRRNGLT